MGGGLRHTAESGRFQGFAGVLALPQRARRNALSSHARDHHDTRVMPAHSFKFAAALQAAQAGPAPVLLRVRLSTGHGTGPTTSQLIEEKADALSFLIENLGIEADRNPL